MLSACAGNRSKVVPAEIEPESRFGTAVAVTASYRVIGAPGMGGSGTVYVFDDDPASGPMSTISAFQGAPGDQFGAALASDSDVLLVGAPLHEADGILAGSAFLYAYDAGQRLWIQQDDLQAEAPSDLDYFGSSVSLSPDLVAVGAPGDDELDSNAGAVYIFTRGTAGWTLAQKLLAEDGAAGDRFGESVAVYGQNVLVGSPFAFGGESRTGAAYLYARSDTSFEVTASFRPESTEYDQEFGAAVALDADHAYVGAPGPGNPETEGGSVHIFDRASDSPAAATVLTAGSGVADSGFGISVSASEGAVVVGAQRPVGDHAGPGSAHVFAMRGSSWSLVNRFTGPEPSRADGFGSDVSLRGNRLVVGAAGDGDSGPNAGASYFFERILDPR